MAYDNDPGYSLFAKLRPWLLGVAVAAGLGGLYYFLATRGPRKVETPSTTVALAGDAELARLSAEVAALEDVWKRADAEGRGGSPEAREALAGAISKQRERVRRDARATPAESEYLRRLEQRQADGEAKEILAKVSLLEAEAKAARESDQEKLAVEKLRAAVALLGTVNSSGASSALKDVPRENRLKLDAEILEAQPLFREFTEARARAERAARQERWGEVRAAFEDALAIQVRLNREFPRTPYVDPAAEAKMETRIQSLQASLLADKVRGMAGGGEVRLREGRYAEAARLFAQAKEAQEKINTTFPKSEQYSPESAEHLEAGRQSALSGEELVRLRWLEEESIRLLKARDITAAQTRITESAELGVRIWREFPRSRLLDESLRVRVNFRKERAVQLPAIHEGVFGQLQEIAAAGGRFQILRRETSQGLYTAVVGKNPSRTPGPDNPVESVSWLEAREFCQKLGWLLGRDVHLPTEAQFRAAILSPEVMAGSEGVDEWLDTDEAALTAPVVTGSGGGGEDNALNLSQTGKSERSRRVGFRFVAE